MRAVFQGRNRGIVSWPGELRVREPQEINDSLASRLLEQLPGGVLTKNQDLAALRHFLDALAACHAVVLNSFQ